jgi:hypothetical protein
VYLGDEKTTNNKKADAEPVDKKKDSPSQKDDEEEILCPGFTGNQTLANCKELNSTEKLLIAILNGLSTRGWCWPSNYRLSQWMGLSLGRTKNMLSSLQNRKFISKIGVYRGHSKRVVRPDLSNRPVLTQELLDKHKKSLL